jgi:2-hydroxychromene-2-carboxylate isomerase
VTRLADGPAFYFDLGSPDAYLLAERVLHAMPVATEWVPVLASELPGHETEAHDVRDRVGETAASRGLQPLRWPDPFPFDSTLAMRAATYAKQIGRTVPFALAAFRQAFAGGRDLSEVDNVLLAAAACELHPRAVLTGIEMRSVKDQLRTATEEAIARGVTGVPSIAYREHVFWGDDRLEEAAGAIR